MKKYKEKSAWQDKVDLESAWWEMTENAKKRQQEIEKEKK